MSLIVDLKKQLGDFSLEVSFETDRGVLGLLGASGSGKSVTLRCIAGILTPDEGRILLDGVPLFDSARHIDLPPQQRRVGYLFQQYALFPHLTVAQNIAAAVRERGRREAVTAEKLRQFRLEEVSRLRPAQLSGGQQQRTALARILASEPRAILLDEPFSALDGALQEQLELELNSQLSAFPGPVLWVSHDRGEVYRNCGRVCALDRGRSQGVCTADNLFFRPVTKAQARLAGCRNLSRAVPQGWSVLLPEWGLTLACGRSVPEGTLCAGLPAGALHPAAPGEENAFSCTILHRVEELTGSLLFLRPERSLPGAPLLRMATAREARFPRDEITVAIPPTELLLLR